MSWSPDRSPGERPIRPPTPKELYTAASNPQPLVVIARDARSYSYAALHALVSKGFNLDRAKALQSSSRVLGLSSDVTICRRSSVGRSRCMSVFNTRARRNGGKQQRRRRGMADGKPLAGGPRGAICEGTGG